MSHKFEHREVNYITEVSHRFLRENVKPRERDFLVSRSCILVFGVEHRGMSYVSQQRAIQDKQIGH